MSVKHFTRDSQDEDDGRQYHGRSHRVELKDGTVIIGQISRVNYEKRTFLLLEPNKIGMLGKDGIEVPWDDCKSVMAEQDKVGVFSDNMIPKWAVWAATNAVRE